MSVGSSVSSSHPQPGVSVRRPVRGSALSSGVVLPSSALAQGGDGFDGSEFPTLREGVLPRASVVSLGRRGKGYAFSDVRSFQPSLRRPSVSTTPAPERLALTSFWERGWLLPSCPGGRR